MSIERDGVDDVRDLHLRAASGRGPGTSLSSTKPGADDDHAEHQHAAPEDDLLAGVEAVRRRLLAAEHAAGALAATSRSPRVGRLSRRKVKNTIDQRDGEQRPDEVVRRLQQLGQPAEQRGRR